jgi:hypothetical protein
MALLLEESEQTDESLEITQTHNGFAGGEMDKRVDGGKICPGRWKRAHIPCGGIVKEDAGFTPGDALRQERKTAIEEWMKGMGYSEVNIIIQWIGYR